MAIPNTIKKIGILFKNRISMRTLFPYVLIRIKKSDLKIIVDYCQATDRTIEEVLIDETLLSIEVEEEAREIEKRLFKSHQ